MSHNAYGLWHSPLTARSLARSSRLYDLQWDSDGHTLVWLVNQGTGSELLALDTRSPDAPYAAASPTLAVRAGVGYGGGDFTVGRGAVYVAEKSGCIYRQQLGVGIPHRLTPAYGGVAAPTLSPDGRWLLFVQTYQQQDVIALVDSDGYHAPLWVAQGHDFFMQPCWHPTTTNPESQEYRVAYVAWNYPAMPWDSSLLYLATLRQYAPDAPPVCTHRQIIAGGKDTAIFQPAFSPDGEWLAYVSDADGWAHLYAYHLASGSHRQLTYDHAEYSTPAWVQGMRTYTWSHDSRTLYAIRNAAAVHHLYAVPLAEGADATPVTGLEAYTYLSQPTLAPDGRHLALIAAAPHIPPRAVVMPINDHDPMPSDASAPRIVQRTDSELLAPHDLATGDAVQWQTDDGRTVYGVLYLPPGVTRASLAATDSLPPAIVRVHGGPTTQATLTWAADAQFFATRGYVVLLVNHRGSTGYGRAYTRHLQGQWGIADVADTLSAARYLAHNRIADGERLVVMGNSAGGYTVLEALCQSPGTFRAGICLYGVSNLFTLVEDTHKFEARYLDGLVGELPAATAVYRERSPVFHAERIRDALAVFQGTADTIVPQSQSDAIVAALRRSGTPHEYHIYEGEGHGWRKPETIESFYNTVLAFLREHVHYR